MLQRVDYIKGLPFQGPGTYLHLGCGPQILDGFVNIDKYHKDSRVTQADLRQLPFGDGSVDTIYSSHALEHLPLRHSLLAIREWARALASGGKLFLAIPDLEACMESMLRKDIPHFAKWTWFVYTIFGYQVDSSLKDPPWDTPLDLGQFHQCGYSKDFIREQLEGNKFRIQTIYNYDGWDTPSIWIEATKN